MQVELMNAVVGLNSNNNTSKRKVFNQNMPMDIASFNTKKTKQNPSFGMIADRSPAIDFELYNQRGVSELIEQFKQFKAHNPGKTPVFDTVQNFLLDLKNDANRIGTRIRFTWRNGAGEPYECAICNSASGMIFHQKKVLEGNIDGLYKLVNNTNGQRLKRFVIDTINKDSSFWGSDGTVGFNEALSRLR